MGGGLQHHDALAREAIEAYGGTVLKTVGHALCAVFADPAAAIPFTSLCWSRPPMAKEPCRHALVRGGTRSSRSAGPGTWCFRRPMA